MVLWFFFFFVFSFFFFVFFFNVFFFFFSKEKKSSDESDERVERTRDRRREKKFFVFFVFTLSFCGFLSLLICRDTKKKHTHLLVFLYKHEKKKGECTTTKARERGIYEEDVVATEAEQY